MGTFEAVPRGRWHHGMEGGNGIVVILGSPVHVWCLRGGAGRDPVPQRARQGDLEETAR